MALARRSSEHEALNGNPRTQTSKQPNKQTNKQPTAPLPSALHKLVGRAQASCANRRTLAAGTALGGRGCGGQNLRPSDKKPLPLVPAATCARAETTRRCRAVVLCFVLCCNELYVCCNVLRRAAPGVPCRIAKQPRQTDRAERRLQRHPNHPSYRPVARPHRTTAEIDAFLDRRRRPSARCSSRVRPCGSRRVGV